MGENGASGERAVLEDDISGRAVHDEGFAGVVVAVDDGIGGQRGTEQAKSQRGQAKRTCVLRRMRHDVPLSKFAFSKK